MFLERAVRWRGLPVRRPLLLSLSLKGVGMPMLAVVAMVLELAVIAVALGMLVISGTVWREDARDAHLKVQLVSQPLEELGRRMLEIGREIRDASNLERTGLERLVAELRGLAEIYRGERGSFLSETDAQNLRALITVVVDRAAAETATAEEYRRSRHSERDALSRRLNQRRDRVSDGWRALDSGLGALRRKDREPDNRLYDLVEQLRKPQPLEESET